MTQRLRERLAIGLVIAGALTTLATSKPLGASVSDQHDLELTEAAPVHVVVRASRAAIDSADSGRVAATIQGDATATLTLTPDDASLPPSSGAGAAFVSLAALDELCPGDGDCDLGFEVSVESAAPVSVRLFSELGGNADVLPEGATIEIVVE